MDSVSRVYLYFTNYIYDTGTLQAKIDRYDSDI